MIIPYYEVLAFTKRHFAGNPAGVCVLESEWLPDALMQSIAAENNLAETAFIIDRGNYFDLRWMTPTVEVDLCGHATLASAHVLFHHRNRKGDAIRFQSKSGELRVDRKDGRLILDFPSQLASNCEPPKELFAGLRAQPSEILKGRDYFAVFAREEDVAAIEPDFEILTQLDTQGVIVTAPGNNLRFRFALFRASRRHSGGSGYRIDTLRVDSVLVEANGKTRAARAPNIKARRRIVLRRSR